MRSRALASRAVYAVLACGGSWLCMACGSDSTGGGGYAGSATAGTSSAGTSSGGTSAGGTSSADAGAGTTSGGAGNAGANDGGANDAGANSGGSAGTTGGAAKMYVADLRGYSQVPRVVTTASGTATLMLSADGKTLTYHVKHNVTQATKAHLHFGSAGENGGILYPLEPLSADMTGTIAIAIASADVAALDAGKIYVNVHSMADADGELRGQVLHAGEVLYVATLTPDQEVPPNTATSSGTATLIVDADKKSFRYHVQSTLAAPTAAHIHRGLATFAGPHNHVFANLQTIDGTDTFLAGEADDLVQGRWYVNLHTAANANGEIRGQLLLPGETLYSALLADTNETPPVTSGATGNAQFILSPDQTRLRYEVALFGVTPTMAHIHNGALGVKGPVVYPLTLVPAYAGTPMASGGAVGTQAVTAADLTALDAGYYYVNAHSTAFADGATRGQLTHPKQ